MKIKKVNMISRETKEGFRRLFLEADLTYQNFGIFKKLPKNWRLFKKWKKLNNNIWKLYWKISKPKFRRIGYF